MAYHWPGNVRELRNVIERAIILSENELLTAHLLPGEITRAAEETESAGPFTTLEQNEKSHILRVLNHVGNNRNQASRILHIGRKTLYRKMLKYGIPG
jgi:two-component system NtrC family response regulator